MVSVFINGKMVENMKEIMFMIRNKDKEDTIGQMVNVFKVFGLMVKDKG